MLNSPGSILLWLAFSAAVGLYANSKGRSGWGFGLLAIAISPLLAFAILLIITKGDSTKQSVPEGDLISRATGYRKCPACGERSSPELESCPSCGKEFPVTV